MDLHWDFPYQTTQVSAGDQQEIPTKSHGGSPHRICMAPGGQQPGLLHSPETALGALARQAVAWLEEEGVIGLGHISN